MTKRTKYLWQGFAMLLAPLVIATLLDWYLIVFAYYLVLFGIFVHAELGWKGVVFHILFILGLLLLASNSDKVGGSTEYYESHRSGQVDR